MSKQRMEEDFVPDPPSPELSNKSNSPVKDTLHARLRQIRSVRLNLDDYRRFYRVPAFWDFDNSGLPNTCSASNLRPMINKALKGFHSKLYLGDVIGFGDISKFKEGDFDILKKEFNLQNIISREKFCSICFQLSTGRVTDDADTALIKNMLLHAYDLTLPGNILVISGVEDFATSIQNLKERGFTMFLAHNELATQKLKNSSTVNWLWSRMTAGKKHGYDD